MATHGLERRLRFATVLAVASLAMAVSPEVVWAQAKMYWTDFASAKIPARGPRRHECRGPGHHRSELATQGQSLTWHPLVRAAGIRLAMT